MNENYRAGVNAAEQDKRPDSLLNFYRRLIRVRQSSPAIVTGTYEALAASGESVLAFLRRDLDTNQTCLVALNFSDQVQALSFAGDDRQLHVLFSSQERGNAVIPMRLLNLFPFEILIAELH